MFCLCRLYAWDWLDRPDISVGYLMACSGILLWKNLTIALYIGDKYNVYFPAGTRTRDTRCIVIKTSNGFFRRNFRCIHVSRNLAQNVSSVHENKGYITVQVQYSSSHARESRSLLIGPSFDFGVAVRLCYRWGSRNDIPKTGDYGLPKLVYAET